MEELYENGSLKNQMRWCGVADLAQDGDEWRDVVSTVTNTRVL